MKRKAYQLAELADIRAGYPFRGAVEPMPNGDVHVVQMKNANDISGISWTRLIKTELAGRRSPDWLQTGDILFLARGNRNFAICLDSPPAKTVCSPHFFQIHIRNVKKILPAFLAWYINQLPSQQYLTMSAEGSLIGNIRRGVLESLSVAVPSVEKQQTIIELDTLLKQERMLLQQRTENNHKMMHTIARRFFAEVS
jgi:hypothetical protein